MPDSSPHHRLARRIEVLGGRSRPQPTPPTAATTTATCTACSAFHIPSPWHIANPPGAPHSAPQAAGYRCQGTQAIKLLPTSSLPSRTTPPCWCECHDAVDDGVTSAAAEEEEGLEAAEGRVLVVVPMTPGEVATCSLGGQRVPASCRWQWRASLSLPRGRASLPTLARWGRTARCIGRLQGPLQVNDAALVQALLGYEGGTGGSSGGGAGGGAGVRTLVAAL